MSHHRMFRAARRIGDWPPDEPLEVSVVCRRNPTHDHERLIAECEHAPIHDRRVWRGREFDAVFGASPVEIARVAATLERHGFDVRRADRRTRLVTARGNARAVARVFGISLGRFDVRGAARRGHDQPIDVKPSRIAPLVEAVLGLDDLPIVAGPRVAVAPVKRSHTYLPRDLIRFYRFPAAAGDGEIIGLPQLAGGFTVDDVQSYFRRAGVRRSMPVSSGRNRPAALQTMQHLVKWMNGTAPHAPEADLDAARWTFENTLDIEVAGACAPGAALRIVFAGSDDERGAIHAVRALLHGRPRPTVMSISWALSPEHGPESTSKADVHKSPHRLLEDAFGEAMLLGITVCCASGDRGSGGDDGSSSALQVDYPAASTYVLACGGTTLAPRRGRPASETVWNAQTAGIRFASGGGLITDGTSPPLWQNRALTTWARKTHDRHPTVASIGRGVPDVAGSADFNAGCLLIVAGLETRAGGTSASAPLWAALVARLNSALWPKTGKRIGFANPALYGSATAAFNNIGRGHNNIGNPAEPYHAVPGTWDPCTGLGTPRGDALLEALERQYRPAKTSRSTERR